MYDDKKVLAIIPARGGSKRLLNKNFKEFFNEKSLLDVCVQKCIDSHYVDEILVLLSPQDDHILTIKRPNITYQKRCPNLDGDDVGISEVCKYEYQNYCKDLGTYNPQKEYDIIVILQCDHPLFFNIDEAIDTFIESGQSELICFRKEKNIYIKNGAIRVVTPKYLLSEKMSQTAVAIFDDSIDIHFEEDFRIAQEQYSLATAPEFIAQYSVFVGKENENQVSIDTS